MHWGYTKTIFYYLDIYIMCKIHVEDYIKHFLRLCVHVYIFFISEPAVCQSFPKLLGLFLTVLNFWQISYWKKYVCTSNSGVHVPHSENVVVRPSPHKNISFQNVVVSLYCLSQVLKLYKKCGSCFWKSIERLPYQCILFTLPALV